MQRIRILLLVLAIVAAASAFVVGCGSESPMPDAGIDPAADADPFAPMPDAPFGGGPDAEGAPDAGP